MDWIRIFRNRESWKLAVVIILPLFILGLILIFRTSTSAKTCSEILNQFEQTIEPQLRLWPNARVPYTIDQELDPRAQRFIRKAIKGIEDKTCIRFIDKDSKSDRNWINFVQDDQECVYPETVGMSEKGRGGQNIVISSDCLSSGHIQRYLGLTLGLGFEETRPDRNNFVRYSPNLPECLAGTSNLPNISKLHHPAAVNILFDYYSHMFVDTKCFRPIGPSQVLVNSNYGTRLGFNQNESLKLGSSGTENGGTFSILDIEKLNAIYNCSGCHSYRFRPVNEVTDQIEPFESFNPVLAGENFEDLPVYICRVYHHGSLLTGKLFVKNQHVPICWTSEIVKSAVRGYVFFKNFEVLMYPKSAKLNWHKIDGSNSLPNNTIVGGMTSTRRQFYIGRCRFESRSWKSVIPGFVFPGETTASIVGETKGQHEQGPQQLCSPVEVLTCEE